jgi:hypothetical protein
MGSERWKSSTGTRRPAGTQPQRIIITQQAMHLMMAKRRIHQSSSIASVREFRVRPSPRTTNLLLTGHGRLRLWERSNLPGREPDIDRSSFELKLFCAWIFFQILDGLTGGVGLSAKAHFNSSATGADSLNEAYTYVYRT